jgi:hypothetical protein
MICAYLKDRSLRQTLLEILPILTLGISCPRLHI